MACLVVSVAMTSLVLAVLLSPSVPKVASISRPATSLIKEVCVGKEIPIDYNFCVEVLNSEPRVVSASDLVRISIAIIEAGISRAAKTQWYVQKLLKQPGMKPADYSYVLQQCDTGYEYYRRSLANALDDVKVEDYFSAAWSLKNGYTIYINQCRNALSSKKIKDGVISKGNEFMHLFGEVAYQAVYSMINN